MTQFNVQLDDGTPEKNVQIDPSAMTDEELSAALAELEPNAHSPAIAELDLSEETTLPDFPDMPANADDDRAALIDLQPLQAEAEQAEPQILSVASVVNELDMLVMPLVGIKTKIVIDLRDGENNALATCGNPAVIARVLPEPARAFVIPATGRNAAPKQCNGLGAIYVGLLNASLYKVMQKTQGMTIFADDVGRYTERMLGLLNGSIKQAFNETLIALVRFGLSEVDARELLNATVQVQAAAANGGELVSVVDENDNRVNEYSALEFVVHVGMVTPITMGNATGNPDVYANEVLLRLVQYFNAMITLTQAFDSTELNVFIPKETLAEAAVNYERDEQFHGVIQPTQLLKLLTLTSQTESPVQYDLPVNAVPKISDTGTTYQYSFSDVGNRAE